MSAERRKMNRVHPNTSTSEAQCSSSSGSCSVRECPTTAVLTVWRKSLVFNCSGFTVFDADGNLAYRVDSYSSGRGREIVLMDASGKPLFTSRRKMLSLSFSKKWLVYEGEATAIPLFSVKKHSRLRHSKTLAHITPCSASNLHGYEIEGSYAQRSCVIYGDSRQQLAEITQKEAAANGAIFGADVFRLVVYPGMDRTVTMAIVVLLDQLFPTRD